MEWIDTLMLESNRQKSFFETPGRGDDARIDSIKAVSARVLAVQGISLMHAAGRTTEELTVALEILRGFRATGSRVVLCDASTLSSGRQAGQLLVEQGDAKAVISCGTHGRDLAIGARDAGLDLSSVVVCRHVKAACVVLVHRLVPGDTVLLWGVDNEVCNRLVNWLDKYFSERTTAAA
jgi:hypothetical protein